MLTLAYTQTTRMHGEEVGLRLLVVGPRARQCDHDRAGEQEVGRSGAHQRDEADVLRRVSELRDFVDMEAKFED